MLLSEGFDCACDCPCGQADEPDCRAEPGAAAAAEEELFGPVEEKLNATALSDGPQ